MIVSASTVVRLLPFIVAAEVHGIDPASVT